MKTLRTACAPRPNVFDRSRRDGVLDLTDLIDPKKINSADFFEENYVTQGMGRLFKETFRRFKGQSQQGLFKLTQAMGGGKTHNMIALALLSRDPGIRSKVLDGIADHQGVGKVRVVAFTGRESDAPLGIWGSIADQLGKRDEFNGYYSPLSAPGQNAWVNLLKGEPLLILLDELPPYLEGAKAKTIGNSDLSVVTAQALSNLFNALGKEELSNVAVVISDLRATYSEGSQQISQVLNNLEGELSRGTMNLEPVGLNTDELYHILRKRLFISLPSEAERREIAQAYAQALKDARQMDITAASPEAFAAQVMESYPFHPAIRDLYARFKENPGFQQTRGLIRLMRVILARMYADDGIATQNYLIHAHDLDLNDRDTLAEVSQINPSLDVAITHDIASQGKSIAELMDANLGTTHDAQDVCKLILMSSLASVHNGVVGLTSSEIVSYLCSPGRDVSRIPKEIIDVLSTRAWYLHPTRDGKFFFKNVQNILAKIKSIADSYNRESSIKELRGQLAEIFTPNTKDCYQTITALQPLDEIQITQDKVTLVIYEPHSGAQVHPDIDKFYSNLQYKNRVLFLTGSRGSLENLVDNAKEMKAIKAVLSELEAERVRDDDPLKLQATTFLDKKNVQFLSALRETFTTLFYPSKDRLMPADLPMTFSDNRFEGERQIKKALEDKQKFTSDVAGDLFRRKTEARLFTTQRMLWSEVLRRSASAPEWQWHIPAALETLRTKLVSEDQWRDDGHGYVDKGPFPLPHTAVSVRRKYTDESTGEVLLEVIPTHGDVVYFEVGREATNQSQRVTDFSSFRTKELIIHFLCEDSKGQHQTGSQYVYRGVITTKHRLYQAGNDQMMEMQSVPSTATIKYSTDGSDPRNGGQAYKAPVALPRTTRVVRYFAESNGLFSEVKDIPIDWENLGQERIDPDKQTTWRRRHDLQTTKDTYEFLSRVQKFGAQIPAIKITVRDLQGSDDQWVELSTGDAIDMDYQKIESMIRTLRELVANSEVRIFVDTMKFQKGQSLLDWVADIRGQIQSGEVVQK